MAKLIHSFSHKTGTQNVGFFMPFIRDFPVFKRRMHQVHEFAFVFDSSFCQPAPARWRVVALKIDVVNEWAFLELNSFISFGYIKKISPRKGDYAG